MYTDISKIGKKERKAVQEKQSQIRFFRKTLDEHCANKPVIDMTETDPEKLHNTTQAVAGWAYRRGKLIRTLDELGYEFKGDNERVYRESLEQGRAFREIYGEQSFPKISDMSTVPNTIED
jgi:hypothetical protein